MSESTTGAGDGCGADAPHYANGRMPVPSVAGCTQPHLPKVTFRRTRRRSASSRETHRGRRPTRFLFNMKTTQERETSVLRAPLGIRFAALAILGSGLLVTDSYAQDELDQSVDPGSIRKATLAGNPRAQGRPANQATMTSFASAAGYTLTTIYLNHPASPTNVAPGLAIPFTPGGGSTTAFLKPWLSRDGSHWLIEADVNTGSTTDDGVYILDGTLIAQEGTQAPFAAVGDLWGTMDDTVGLSNAGEVLVTNNLGGTAATATDDVVAFRNSAGVWSVLVTEGDDMGTILPAFAGVTWDDSMDTPVLTDNGLTGWQASGIDGTPAGPRTTSCSSWATPYWCSRT